MTSPLRFPFKRAHDPEPVQARARWPWPVPRFAVGDRVKREVFMDDGTWTREGDSCLRRSPFRFGRVVKVARRGWVRGLGGAPGFDSDEVMYHVEWEDGYRPGSYFAHGLDPAVNEGA